MEEKNRKRKNKQEKQKEEGKKLGWHFCHSPTIGVKMPVLSPFWRGIFLWGWVENALALFKNFISFHSYQTIPIPIFLHLFSIHFIPPPTKHTLKHTVATVILPNVEFQNYLAIIMTSECQPNDYEVIEKIYLNVYVNFFVLFLRD